MEYPPVSVVMPVRNEERHLAESVRHILAQDYPGPIELLYAEVDADRLIAAYRSAHPRA